MEAGGDNELRSGDIYEDCAYHPVLATYVSYENDEIAGISLVDGSVPRSCSLRYCGVRRLTVREAVELRAARLREMRPPRQSPSVPISDG